MNLGDLVQFNKLGMIIRSLHHQKQQMMMVVQKNNHHADPQLHTNTILVLQPGGLIQRQHRHHLEIVSD